MREETAKLERMAKETVKSVYGEAEAAETPEARARLGKWAAQIRGAMLELAQSEPGIAVTPQQLDADPWLLTVTNGTLDLRLPASTLRPHDPGDLITRMAPVAFDPPRSARSSWRSSIGASLNGRTSSLQYAVRRLPRGTPARSHNATVGLDTG